MLLSILLQIFRRSKNDTFKLKQLLVVVFAGVLVGYIMTDSEKNNSKEATILVKINFDAGNYVYDAIDLINLKIISKDKNFSKEIMLDETESIDEILISPIVDIKDIMEKEFNANEIRHYLKIFNMKMGFQLQKDLSLIMIIT